jgi:hypothetical protein
MPADRPFRTREDLERTIRAIATEFNADEVFIVGSQAILMAWPNAPISMRISMEIDAYPGNVKAWEMKLEKDGGGEASERIHALFGFGSQFHQTHGFYIDGVDETTAVLPPDWRQRAVITFHEVGGRKVAALAPCPEDLIVSKLARLDEKDKSFIEAYHAERPLDADVIEKRIRSSKFEPAAALAALQYIKILTKI